MKKVFSIFLLISVLILTLCSCGSQKYVIATDDSFAPFCSVNLKGETVGFDIDLINLIAKTENFKVEIVPLGLVKSLDALENNDVDAVMAALIPSADMNEKYDFSDYYNDEYALAVNKGRNEALIEKFNDGLQKIIENGKYKELCEKYFSGADLYE